jgi:hypothetical protein
VELYIHSPNTPSWRRAEIAGKTLPYSHVHGNSLCISPSSSVYFSLVYLVTLSELQDTHKLRDERMNVDTLS